MNFRKLTSAFCFALISMSAAAQTSWTVQSANIADPSACVADISAVGDTVAWAISAVLDPSSGGSMVPTASFTRTKNGGNTWVAGTISLPASYTPTCIHALNGQTAWVTAFDLFSFASGRIYKTTNGGTTWVQQSTPPFPDAARFIHFYNATEGVVVGDSSVFTTSNGGTTWVTSATLPLPFGVPTVFLLNSYEVLGNKIWLGDVYGDFYKSTNRGKAWTKLPSSLYPDAIKGIAFKDSMNGIAVGAHLVTGGGGGGGYTDDARINHTSDGGITWTTTSIVFGGFTIAPYTAKYDVAYVPGTANTYILTSEYSGTVGYSAISYDGGMIWQPIDSNIKHTALAFAANGKGWSGGYYTSPSAGMFRWGTVTATGLSENTEAASKMSAYPNPVVDQLQLGFAKPLSNATITVVDASGKVLSEQKIGAQPVNQFVIPTGMLPRGTYFIKVETPSGTLTSQFVK